MIIIAAYPTLAQNIMHTNWKEIQQMYRSQKFHSTFSAHLAFPNQYYYNILFHT